MHSYRLQQSTFVATAVHQHIQVVNVFLHAGVFIYYIMHEDYNNNIIIKIHDIAVAIYKLYQVCIEFHNYNIMHSEHKIEFVCYV